MNYGIKHKNHYIEEHRGYHGGEGFGGKIKVLDEVEYFNLEEGLEEKLENLILDKEVEEINFENFKITSIDIDTEEEIEIEISKSEIKEKFIKVLNNIPTEFKKNFINELKEAEDFYKEKIQNEEKEYRKIYIILNILEISKKYMEEKIPLEKLLKDKKEELKKEKTFEKKSDIKYQINQINKKIEVLRKEEEKQKKEIKEINKIKITKEIKNKYEKIKKEAIKMLKQIEELKETIKNTKSKNIQKNNKKFPEI